MNDHELVPEITAERIMASLDLVPLSLVLQFIVFFLMGPSSTNRLAGN